MRNLGNALAIVGLIGVLVAPGVSRASPLGDQEGNSPHHLILLSGNELAFKNTLPIRDLHTDLTPIERLIDRVVRNWEQAKLTGWIPTSFDKKGSGRGGSACFDAAGPLLLCFGGNEINASRLDAVQGKVGVGAYLRERILGGALTLVAGPELRLSVSMQGIVPQSISFVEGGIGISAF